MLYRLLNEHNFTRLFIITLSCVILSACGSGGKSNDASTASNNEDSTGSESTVDNTVVILSNPLSQSVDENSLVTFSVSASGGDLKYQWRKDGVHILGATEPTFVIADVKSIDHGIYDVVVSNNDYTVTSLSAILLVNIIEGFSVSLNWDIPELRNDGSDLEVFEINGYVVAYGLSAQNLNSLLTVTGAEQTSAVVDGLSANTYYFAIATIDSQGLRGPYSNIIEQQLF